MGVAHVGLVHCDPCNGKVKGFHAVSSIERCVSKKHLQEMQQQESTFFCCKWNKCYILSFGAPHWRLVWP